MTITPDSIQIARLEERFGAMQVQIEEMSEQMSALQRQTGELLSQLQEARGSVKTLLAIGSAGAAIGTLGTWMLQHVTFKG
jgi:TolA-binding protein